MSLFVALCQNRAVDEPRSFLPPGSGPVAVWAHQRGLLYDPRPDERWFRAFEPFDTLISPARYFNACTANAPPGSITLVEPWTEEDESEPLDRTVLSFVVHPRLGARASARSGEHFLTRVSFLVDPPPPQVTLGDAVWDAHVTTFAPSSEEARRAFTPALRELLRVRAFSGHLELRPGAAVIHLAGISPTPQGYESALAAARAIVDAALR